MVCILQVQKQKILTQNTLFFLSSFSFSHFHCKGTTTFLPRDCYIRLLHVIARYFFRHPCNALTNTSLREKFFRTRISRISRILFWHPFGMEIYQKSYSKSFKVSCAVRRAVVSPSDSLPAPRQSSLKQAWCCHTSSLHPRVATILHRPAA